MHRTYPVLALVRHAPAIDCQAFSIRFRPRPFHAHVACTLYSLSQVVEAVMQVVAAISIDEHLYHALLQCSVVLFDRIEQGEGVAADLPEAVDLMEERGAVYHAPSRLLPWRVVV
jgi:hypothetical protein